MKTRFTIKPQRLAAHWRLGLALLLGGSLATSVQAQNSGSVTTTQSFSYTGQIETWTVPTGVTSLTVEARGAQGSNASPSRFQAGLGAVIASTISVTPGQKLKILVGQQRNPGDVYSNGGGGGTFVTDLNNAPLVIAGGGGGSGNADATQKHGQAGTSAGNGGGNSAGTGGNSGNGGITPPPNGYLSYSGGGLLTAGSGGYFPEISNGIAFVDGGAGGQGNGSVGYTSPGGFGGGGCGGGNVSGGGGGGYSGGGCGGANFRGEPSGGVGGGGGSFTAGPRLFARTGAIDGNPGNGLVIITYTLCSPFTANLTNDGPLTCAKKSVNLLTTGGPAGATYLYSPEATANANNPAIASVSQSGPYSVTVTAPDGCSVIATTTVSSNTTAPSVSINPPTQTVCQSANLTAEGATTYQWSTGDTTATISATASGSYSVTGTTSNGCSDTASARVTINQPVTITSQFQSLTTVCGTNTSGQFSVSATGTGPLTLQFFRDDELLDQLTNYSGSTVSYTQQLTRSANYQFVIISACNSVTTTLAPITVNPLPPAPSLVTQSGQPYPAGVSSLTVSQNTGDVVLVVLGCQDGTINWNGGSNSTLAVSTANLGTQSFTATCTSNSTGCTSPVATATVTVVAPTLKVLSRDPDNGQLNNNTIKPYLLLQNEGTTPIPYSTITLRYWLTTENTIPLVFQKNYVAIGQNNLNLRYVPISPTRQGATGYIEYSFSGGAGSLAPNGDSGPLEIQVNKQDYSSFFQGEDYSYSNTSSFTLNPRITAYQNGMIFYGQEPSGTGSARVLGEESGSGLSVKVLGNPVVGQAVEVEVSGVSGQAVQLKLTDLQGKTLRRQSIDEAGTIERVSLPLDNTHGMILLDVSTATQRQNIKLVRP